MKFIKYPLLTNWTIWININPDIIEENSLDMEDCKLSSKKDARIPMKIEKIVVKKNPPNA